MMEVILISILAIGLVTLVLPELEDLYAIICYRIREWCCQFKNQEEWLDARQLMIHHRGFEHVRRLLMVTYGLGTKKSVMAFFLLSAFLGIVTMIRVGGQLSLVLTIAAGFASSVLPYLFLRCKIQSQRVASSQEGEIFVTEILNNYKIQYCNMRQAIEVTAVSMEDAPHCKRILLHLARSLRKASTSGDLEALMEEFRFAIGTSWANILATNIFLACHSGMLVTESLSDLARSMRQARKLEEFSKRENNEARWMIFYLTPIGGLLLVVGGFRFFRLSPAMFYHYQFQTAIGLTWFVIWLVVYLATVGVTLLMTRRKFDL
ncbi:MAG: hypothetical protein HFE73_02740 [Firmicutes bacterium]|nr:hypothetical protein [Bacillota bacterium]